MNTSVDHQYLWCHNSVFVVNLKKVLHASMALGPGVTGNLRIFLPLLSLSLVLCFKHFRHAGDVRLCPLPPRLSGTAVLWLDSRSLHHGQEIKPKRCAGVIVGLTVLLCLLSHAWKRWVHILCPVVFCQQQENLSLMSYYSLQQLREQDPHGMLPAFSTPREC